MPPNHNLLIMNEDTHEIRMEDYDINPITGFLPLMPPLRTLPDEYYEPWEFIIENFHELMLAGRFRTSVDNMPILNVDRLKTPAEYHRAFLVLSFLSHGYVWGNVNDISDRIPASIAIPWVKVSDYLGVAPIANHAAVVLWNWRLIFPDEPFNLNNLSTLLTFTNTFDESWFYLVTTAIEGHGGRALSAIISAVNASNVGDNNQLLKALKGISSIIESINLTLQRMYEKCDPYVFYWKVRPYLAGWENEDRLPYGLIYEGVDGNNEYGNPIYRKYIGGSAGQSALIQALDIVLQIEHFSTCFIKPKVNKVDEVNVDEVIKDNGFNKDNGVNGSNKDNGVNGSNKVYGFNKVNGCDNSGGQSSREGQCHMGNVNICSYMNRNNNNLKCPFNNMNSKQKPYLYKIRENMPGPHRRFLEDLAKIANIRNYIISNIGYDSVEDEEINNLIRAYNECLAQMKNFRNIHLQIVSVYIVIQANRSKTALPIKKEVITKNHTTETIKITKPPVMDSIKGTGGTNLIPFLKQMRDETVAQEIPNKY